MISHARPAWSVAELIAFDGEITASRAACIVKLGNNSAQGRLGRGGNFFRFTNTRGKCTARVTTDVGCHRLPIKGCAKSDLRIMYIVVQTERVLIAIYKSD
jgi:hypothetical protein